MDSEAAAEDLKRKQNNIKRVTIILIQVQFSPVSQLAPGIRK